MKGQEMQPVIHAGRQGRVATTKAQKEQKQKLPFLFLGGAHVKAEWVCRKAVPDWKPLTAQTFCVHAFIDPFSAYLLIRNDHGIWNQTDQKSNTPILHY